MEIQEFVSQSYLDVATLNAWIEEEWLAPIESGSSQRFSPCLDHRFLRKSDTPRPDEGGE